MATKKYELTKEYFFMVNFGTNLMITKEDFQHELNIHRTMV